MKMVRNKTQVAAKQEGEEGGLLGQYVRTFGNLNLSTFWFRYVKVFVRPSIGIWYLTISVIFCGF